VNNPMMLALLLTPAETTALDFSAMFAAFLVVGLATLWWFFGFRKKRHRKRKHRHGSRSHSSRAQAGGLPPLREPEGKSGPPPEV
jgi:hypothetical protein